ncbi:uncharacterized protein LOC141690752 [Apium graveolens]|uniref:uncharacterized protein LOC141690752 n=1 Tax=Apium graveolens TaxID=4045 RepID=UPI003D7B17A0
MVDAKDYVKRCDHCQKHTPVVRQPPEMLTSIYSPIPFAMWGMDILGPFPMVTAQRKYGISRILVTDNGTQFNNEEFKKYYEENNIELWFTYVTHSQANGQAEVANWIILDGLKKRIEKVTTGATPFMLTYGAEAVVPVEISHSSPRIQAYNAEDNEVGQRLALDLIDEVWDQAHAKIVEY